MALDGTALELIIAFASFFLQIIAIVQQLMTETFESLVLIFTSIFVT